jgi:SAM-dependent methyltransferase
MSKTGYVHGYSESESARLSVQAATLNELLYGDTSYPAGSLVLEAGCGTGAQTPVIMKNSPGASIVSIDISLQSLADAKKKTFSKEEAAEYLNCDIFGLPFAENSFDHIFVCFVLEHLHDPAGALSSLMGVLKPGGTITVIEGDHGSAFFYPENEAAKRNIDCLVELQAEAGGDALIGRRLYPVLISAGFGPVSVSPRMIYVDSSRPDLVEGFTKGTFTAMIEGVERDVVSSGMMNKEEWDEGISALYRTAG